MTPIFSTERLDVVPWHELGTDELPRAVLELLTPAVERFLQALDLRFFGGKLFFAIGQVCGRCRLLLL